MASRGNKMNRSLSPILLRILLIALSFSLVAAPRFASAQHGAHGGGGGFHGGGAGFHSGSSFHSGGSVGNSRSGVGGFHGGGNFGNSRGASGFNNGFRNRAF